MKNILKVVQKRFLDISNTRVKYFGTVKDSRTFHWWCWDAFELEKLENFIFWGTYNSTLNPKRKISSNESNIAIWFLTF